MFDSVPVILYVSAIILLCLRRVVVLGSKFVGYVEWMQGVGFISENDAGLYRCDERKVLQNLLSLVMTSCLEVASSSTRPQ